MIVAPFLRSFAPLKIMETTSVALDTLVRRLDEAERRAKLLYKEVNKINLEISKLKTNISSISSSNNGVVSFAVNTRANSAANDTTDGLETANKKAKCSFDSENGYVVVYTDGACENNGRQNAKAGIGVWFGDNHPLNISIPVEGKATNNTAEIQACVHALNCLAGQGIDKVKLITDSQFTINCMTNWIKNWKRNNWKTSAGGAVKNKEDLIKLDKEVQRFIDVKWEHVTAHRGVRGNEEADNLARKGAQKYRAS